MIETDRKAIIKAVQSFRMGAPILISDIRFACWADGHPINHISSREIPSVLRACCDPVEGRWGPNDYKSWIRRI